MLWPFGKGRSSAGVKETDRHGHGLLNLQRSSYLHPVSFIPGRANASPSNTQGGSPVRESRPLGSVRGVLSNGHSYRDSHVESGCLSGRRPLRWNSPSILAVGIDVRVTRRRQMRHIGLMPQIVPVIEYPP